MMLRRRFRFFLLLVLSCFSLGLFLLAKDIYSFSLVSHERPADAAVVLGATVFRDRPSPVFRERINHAINLYQRGFVENLVFTGGLAGNDRLAESEAARAYAIAQGVPAEKIFIETQSDNTCLNLVGAKRILDENGMHEVLLVSDPLHMRRSMWLAEFLGMQALSSPTPTSRYRSLDRKAGFLLREVYLYGAYLLNLSSCAA